MGRLGALKEVAPSLDFAGPMCGLIQGGSPLPVATGLHASFSSTAKDYENAIKYYSQAIDLNPNNAIYYGNRSLAYLRTECYGYALGDATRAIELDKKYIKGYYRRAASNMALGKFRASLSLPDQVVKVKPNDKDAKMKYQECSKIVKQKAFERAIAGDEHRRSVVDSLDIESMTIEDEYSGPKLEDGKVTITFMKELMQWYREQKKLHRKCAYQILVQVKEVLCKLSTLVETTLEETEKITVCGDTHGQFYDLLNIFELNGLPSETNPYVSSRVAPCGEGGAPLGKNTGTDRHLTVTVVTAPPGYKVTHQCPPSPGLQQAVPSPASVPPCPMCDLLWSEPQPQNGRSVSKRGVSCQFGPDVTKAFLEENQLEYIIRSHEVKAEGYEVAHGGRCVTVFSAPNYWCVSPSHPLLGAQGLLCGF
ncbi:serine/threonine-protein phosphatase 5 isoform X1 [Cricetulus griseus]|uniref:serine/threonine-protein phosphatase 5 isoform X1 n=1 Tax=Cricetulus griseus TaxID=10029 RepID=UPI0007DA7B15|nr:serine/threonine-protein phosphatase 5 isoform X1 [Cricetulus griseus]